MTAREAADPTVSRTPGARPARVLHLFRRLVAGSGGPLTFYQSVVDNLDDARFSVDYATVFACPPPQCLPPPLRTGKAGRPVLAEIAEFAWWLWRILPEIDVVQIHGVFSWQFVIGALLCRLRGVRYVVRPHGSLSGHFLEISPAPKRAYLILVARPLLRRALAVIAMSGREVDDVRALDARLPVKLVLPGVPIPARALGEPAAHPLRILFVGRIAEVKRLPDILDALQKVRSAGMPARLDIIGNGRVSYVAQMKSLAQRLGVAGDVHFHGFLAGEAKREVVESAHVMALMSRGENFSYATAECLALGMPVIITETVALAPYVREASCGRVVALGDVDALAQALLDYHDPLTWREAARNARAWASSQLAPSRMAQALAAIYSEAASSRRRVRLTNP